MIVTALLTFIAGLLTALAPCVLPLLPVILGGSVAGGRADKRRPYIITGSLVVSLIVFTLLLKVSTVFIAIDPRVWTIGSGVLVIILGIFMLVPDLWARIIARLGIEQRAQGLLGSASKGHGSTLSAVLIGAALGPVFSSCSPTYAWVVATVVPASPVRGMVYLAIYCLGVATALLAIALLGRRLLTNIRWASNPYGWFQRGIALLFIVVGVFVATGWDKTVQTYLVDKDFLNLIKLEQRLVPQGNDQTPNGAVLNVTPYQAPELKNIAAWINSDPLTLAGLRDKVVLIDFWTYSCINCQRTQPYVNAWYDKYNRDGFVIIGVHAPEFSFEKVPDNVKRAVADDGIQYPVALDNDFSTWNSYNNQYWPAKYLIDKNGQVRYTHFGEGDYDATETAIQTLLKETGRTVTQTIEPSRSDTSSAGQTPETYLGYGRAERFANAAQFVADQPVDYIQVSSLDQHQWSLGGRWQMARESSQSLADDATLRLRFAAKSVYLVMSGPPGARAGVSVEGESKPGGADVDTTNHVVLDGPRLYHIVELSSFMTGRVMTVTFPAGVTVNALTFGG